MLLEMGLPALTVWTRRYSETFSYLERWFLQKHFDNFIQNREALNFGSIRKTCVKMQEATILEAVTS